MGHLRIKDIEAIIRTGTPCTQSDGQGLTITMSAKGTATWILRYRYAGRQREITLGGYPALSLADARVDAAEKRKALSGGKDPAFEKQIARKAKLGGLTVSELLEDFLSHRGNELRPITVKHHREMFAKDVAKPIGSRLVSDVSAAEIVLLLREVKKRSHSVAKHVWENLSVLFAHGVAISACARSPLADLRPVAILGKAPPRKKRIQLTVQQLMSLCAELPALGEVNRLAILIVLATCVRKSEFLQAQWKEFDLENGSWIVPPDREGNKAGRSYVVPLAPIVVSWLQELQTITVESEYVLPPQASNSRSKLKHMGRDTLNVALNRLPGTVPRFSPHDLRSTARSYLRDLGTRDDVIARALNHSLGGLEEIYQAGDLFLERQQALNYWAQLLNDPHLGTALESEVLPLVLRRPRHVQMGGVTTVQ